MSTLLTRLREETRTLHEQTEHLLYAEALRSGSLSPDEYRHLLLTHFAYHKALEQAIDQHPAFFQKYEPDRRRKTPWLQADLKYLQLTPLVLSPDVFSNWSPVALLGAAYVSEGSMLGGKTVWHYLQQSPALEPLLQNTRFYRGYGEETGTKWRAFGQFLTEQAADHPDEVIGAAGRAFRAYHTLFRESQSALKTAVYSAS